MSHWKPDVMLYHANCADGFGAAWAARVLWGAAVQYQPVSYGERPPEVLGKHVLIGDFSYKRDGIDACLQGAASVVILDHHKTAEADLAPFAVEVTGGAPLNYQMIPDMLRDLAEMDRPPCIASFDMNRSGARMVWDFFFPRHPAPRLIDLIEDRDLWRFKDPDTKAFGLWLRSEPFDFERWELIAQELGDGRDAHRIMSEANAMQRFFDQKVAEIARLARWVNVGGYTVIAVNCPPMFASEVGHKLLEDHPGTPFAACYSDQGTSRGFSLRSADDRVDVSEVARKFGGGGHRNAAGFGVPLA